MADRPLTDAEALEAGPAWIELCPVFYRGRWLRHWVQKDVLCQKTGHDRLATSEGSDR